MLAFLVVAMLHVMMAARLGRFLVAARTSRAADGIGKALAFSLVIFLFTPGVLAPIGGVLHTVAYAIVYGTVFLCVIRGGRRSCWRRAG